METIEQSNKRRETNWAEIEWAKIKRNVRRLQERIYRASQQEQWSRVRSLQKLLVRSYANRLLAIRQVSQDNKGRKTAGIDGVVYDTPAKRQQLSQQLDPLKYHHPAPVRRIYIPKANGKQRPLGIPTQKDRVQQAILKAALEPEWEAKFEPSSYGFRPGKSCHDAISHLFNLLSKRNGSQWILDADISGCFDNIAHAPLLAQIPVFEPSIQRWLKAGVMEQGQQQPTPSGTPQGGTISPLLANIALNGIQTLFKTNRRTGENGGINLVRYADDFVVVANSRAELETVVLPRLKAFLAERGLKLNPEKSQIVHRTTGFNFLGFNVRYYKDKLLIKPQKEKVQQFLRRIKTILKQNRQTPVKVILIKLNPLIRGWCNYYRHCVARKTFTYVSHRLWQMLWRWAIRRHPNKTKQWVKDHYFQTVGRRQWLFGSQTLKLYLPTQTKIRRHRMVKTSYSPYDPALRSYWQQRTRSQLLQYPFSDLKLRCLKQQNYQCGRCRDLLSIHDTIELHHRHPRQEGGSTQLDNLIALHDYCHYQQHHC